MNDDVPCPPSTRALAVVVGTAAVVVHAPGGFSMALPPVIAEAGEDAASATFEFFTARIPNAHTRRAYGRAVAAFCDWCSSDGVALRELTAPTVSGYLNGLQTSAASVKLKASALRHWLDFLTERRGLALEPCPAVNQDILEFRVRTCDSIDMPRLSRAELAAIALALGRFPVTVEPWLCSSKLAALTITVCAIRSAGTGPSRRFTTSASHALPSPPGETAVRGTW
jgi:hypothetical protein